MTAERTAPPLVELSADHPGFRDPRYRARRDRIARAALQHRRGTPPPRIAYTAEEERLWRDVWARLEPLHEERACRAIRERQRALGLGSGPIPQLAEVEVHLARAGGMRLEPVAGLVAARAFLVRLADGVFLCTQYLRHRARPFYTPEPDLLHELAGHAASLTHPRIASLSRAFGRAAHGADDGELERIERAYWFTLEFGLVAEGGEVRALGAGLLSSSEELETIGSGPELADWDLDRLARTPYDPSGPQPTLFVAPSFERMVSETERWLRRGAWRDR